MDNWSALFDGQTRYFLDINDSIMKPDVLRFRGREALSEPFRWDIEFTSRQANIPPEQVLMKYASLRMRGGKTAHGVVTRLEWLSTSRDQSHYRLTLSSRLALKEIDRLNQQLQQLEIAAEQALALKADVDSQIAMFEQRLKPLNEALLMSAPEGMALTSGEHLQMTATKNVAINAGVDISTGTMGNMTALAGEKLGLFAREGQLSLKASEGPVDVQAQNASLRLFAQKKLTMSSASDISFAGKKRITLIGGGSYLKLEAGKVEYGTTASYMRKVKRTMAAGAASIPVKTVTGGGICLSCLMKAAMNGDTFVVRGES
ncbi:DUF2345 domain-containing protein [Enterobacter asburiae]|uniref:DUF2345 domain-containing protein n=1 Tax=Enterobacter asburiae TaxID=61645 RepID=UPI0020057523|nr:DUF2345 domain-containing protein [Enterobacter asburiae]MCK7230488.1 DUF2345 domain-containing protein [Enterobacter asburiae]